MMTEDLVDKAPMMQNISLITTIFSWTRSGLVHGI